MQNFKAQTADEAAMLSYEQLKTNRKTRDNIKKILTRTHEAAIHIIDKKALYIIPQLRPQYPHMIDVPLLFERLGAEHN